MARDTRTLVERVEALVAEADREAADHMTVADDHAEQIAYHRAERTQRIDAATKAGNIRDGLKSMIAANGGGGVVE